MWREEDPEGFENYVHAWFEFALEPEKLDLELQ
jgi:hypothetical protein